MSEFKEKGKNSCNQSDCTNDGLHRVDAIIHVVETNKDERHSIRLCCFHYEQQLMHELGKLRKYNMEIQVKVKQLLDKVERLEYDSIVKR